MNSRRGFAHFFVLLLALFGLTLGTYLVSQRTRLENKASAQTGWGNAAYFQNTPNDWQQANSRLIIPRNSTSPIDLSREFTIEFWLRLNDTSIPRQGILMTSDQNLSISVSNASIEVPGTNRLIVGVNNGTISDAFYLSNRVIENGKWHHVALSYRPDFQGGSFMGSIDGSSTWASWVPFNKPVPFNGASGDILISEPGISGFEIVDGLIDDLRISSVARYPFSTGPISYTPPVSPFINDQNTVALLNFDELSGCQSAADGCVIPDLSGHNNYGKIIGNTQIVPSTIPVTIPTPTPSPTPITSPSPTPTPVVNRPPVAKYTFRRVGRDYRTAKFTNLSTDPDNDLLSYVWDFGDRTTSADANPTHTYPNKVTVYTVTLTAKDNRGGVAKKTQYLLIPLLK